jgi:hypothetical protein
MNGCRYALGLSLLCALVFSGIAASGASAIGTTVVECSETSGSVGFEDPHCVNGTSDKTKVKYVHKELGPLNETKVYGNNEKTSAGTTGREFAVLEWTSLQEKFAITCTEESVGIATVSNYAGPPMSIGGKAIVNFRSCTLTKPAGEGCELVNTEISAKVIFATKENAMEVEFEPEGTEPFASFEIKKCKEFLFNAIYDVTGKASAIPEGATLTTTKVSTESGLTVGKQKASLTSKITMTNEIKTPLAVTTL